jgi:K+-transporting ATPase A subunit
MLNSNEKKVSNFWPAALTAIVIRLLLGITFILALPIFGYDNPRHNAGYIFADAFERDQQAWKLARTPGASVLEAFNGNLPGDQYGGMLNVHS